MKKIILIPAAAGILAFGGIVLANTDSNTGANPATTDSQEMNTAPATPQKEASKELIGFEKATSIALGIAEGKVTDVELSEDGGRQEYEIEIHTAEYEYDFDIDAFTGEVLEQLIHIRTGDVVVAFSFPRYSSTTVQAVSYCRNAGATVVGITNSMLSPLASQCDRVLLAKSDMVSLVDSLVAPLSVVNALIVALASGREEILRGNFDKLESIWQEHHVYEKKDDEL